MSERKKIQESLQKIGIEATLNEAECFWSSYCQKKPFENWIDFDALNEESTNYAYSYFHE